MAFQFTVPNEGLLGRQPTMEIEMNIIRSSSLATVLVLSITVPVHAQNPKQGDYYQPQQATPQQATPGQEQKIQQGDYYKPGATTTPQQSSPAEAQETKQGDYYKPGSK